MLCGVDIRGRAKTTRPSVAARIVEDFLAPNVNGYSKPPAGMRAEEEFGAIALFKCEVIRSHQFHRRAGQNLHITILSFIKHHLAKGEIIIDSRNQTTSA